MLKNVYYFNKKHIFQPKFRYIYDYTATSEKKGPPIAVRSPLVKSLETQQQ